jgi:hypothetical protein
VATRVRRRLSASPRTVRTRTTATPVEVRAPHPKAWAHARALAKGDLNRLRVEADGSVTVLNPQRL